MKKKEIWTYAILVFLVILIILIIQYIKAENHDQETFLCIAENSLLISSDTCSHCATQIAMFGDYKDNLNILKVNEDPTLWDTYDLLGTPTWIINNQTYAGVRSIKELAELTGC